MVKVVRVGIVGGGTVGGGIVDILKRQDEFFRSSLGLHFEIVAVVVRDVAKKRDYELPRGARFVTDYREVLNDDSISLVVEVMGGVGDAKEVVFGALAKKKNVVTANKALIAKYLREVRESVAANGAQFGYEAAVAGGIPIISAMQHSFIGDSISQISGILNGTTNFMLTKMVKEGVAYGDVLAEAQRLGFAEAEPSADVDGYDARAKIVLLSKLAFGIELDETQIPTFGITRLTLDDFKYAKVLESTIKLLGVARRVEGGVSVFVSPVVVPVDTTLANVWGATNVVEVKSSSCQTSLFVGEGAGKLPTANSCVSDMVAIAQGRCPVPFPVDVPKVACRLVPDFESCFYIRFVVRDTIGIIKRIAEVCEENGVGVHSIQQTPIKDMNKVPFVITTEKTTFHRAREVGLVTGREGWSLVEPLVLPMMGSV